MLQPLGDEIQSFRPSARALAPICLLPAAVALPMALRKIAQEDAPLVVIGVALLLAGGAALLMFLLLVSLLSFFQVRVHELGLRGYDAYGRSAGIAWPYIGDVTPTSMLGLAYLRVRPSGSGRELWLPRFLVDQQAFERLVRERAGPAHPLARGLEALLDTQPRP